MRTPRHLRVHLPAALVAATLTLPTPAHPQTKPTQLSDARTLSIVDLSIPAELGYVIETHQPAASSVPATIIHIQEAHANYEAQQHIVAILEQLIERYGLKLILVEGGDGDVGLEYLRSYGPPENRKEVAEKYLKTGVLSAEEYLDIASDHPLILWGVEQKALYEQNVEAFLAAEPLQVALQPVLASVREAAEGLKGQLLDPALSDLDAKAKAFDEQRLGLADYAEALKRAAMRQEVPLGGSPNLVRFLEARRLEQSMQLPLVKQEQQALIGRLSQVAPEERLNGLVAKAEGMKAGTVKAAEFYDTLQQLASVSKVDLSAYPNLSAYIRYVAQSAQIRPTILSDELTALAAELRKSFLATPESRQLTSLLEEVDLVEKLLDFRLSPAEYRRLDSVDLVTIASRWERFVNAQLARQGRPPLSFQALTELAAKLPTVQRFYLVAQQRDEQLVKNALAKLRETKEPVAVLITGGFHSPEITRMLTEQGVGTVVLAPKVTTPTDERLYHAVVKYKSGHGTFDDVLSVANPPLTKAVSR